MKKSIVGEKSYKFSIRVVNFYKYLNKEKKEFILSKQVLRSGTGIGANVQEALGSPTKKDFAYKMSVAYKESLETIYWLNLLSDTGFISKEQAESLIADCQELVKMLVMIQKSSK